MCAEYSYFWDGSAVGDAVIAPYSNDEFSDVWASISQFDHRSAFVVYSDLEESGYFGSFKITVVDQAPNGGSVIIDGGVAIVDGKVYRQVGSESFLMNGDGYYRIILTKTWSKQNVGFGFYFSEVALPDLVQVDGDQWDISILTAQVSSGVLTADVKTMSMNADAETGESRWMNLPPVLGGRQGGSATNWGTGGATNYVVGPCRMEIGSVAVPASPTVVTFTEAFPFTPVVILMPYDAGADWAGNNLWVSAINAANFSISADSVVNLEGVFYIAVGQLS